MIVHRSKETKLKKMYQPKQSCSLIHEDKKEKTALLPDHHFKEKRILDFDNIKILDRENNYYKKRLIREYVSMRCHDSMNYKPDTK